MLFLAGKAGVGGCPQIVHWGRMSVGKRWGVWVLKVMCVRWARGGRSVGGVGASVWGQRVWGRLGGVPVGKADNMILCVVRGQVWGVREPNVWVGASQTPNRNAVKGTANSCGVERRGVASGVVAPGRPGIFMSRVGLCRELPGEWWESGQRSNAE